MSSSQGKRKANPVAEQEKSDVSIKKPRHNTPKEGDFVPQFLDFAGQDSEILLPRDHTNTTQLFSKEAKKAAKISNRQANKDDLFSSKKTMEDSSSEDEKDTIDDDKTIKQVGDKKHDFSTSQIKQIDVGGSIKKALHLTSKTIHVGEILLGTVANITPFELKITLPDGLTGSISYREVSDTLTAKIDAELESQIEDPTTLNINTLRSLDVFENVPSLEELFTIGQQITPMVIKIVDKPHSKTIKQKIFCSLRPSVLNSHYQQSLSLLPSCGIPLLGDIESVEAKGYVVNYGLSFKGFVPFTDSITDDSYPTGALVTTLLPKDRQITATDRTIQVSLDAKKILHHAIGFSAEISFEQVRPGQFYHGTVSKHLPDGGIVVQIVNNFKVTVSALHLPLALNATGNRAQNLTTNYPLTAKVLVRIMAVQSNHNNDGTHVIAGTLHNDLVLPTSLYENNITFTTIAQLGDIKQVKVVKQFGDKALLVKFLHDSTGVVIPDEYYDLLGQKNNTGRQVQNSPILGWLPLRSCADIPLTDFPKQFKVGATVTARVVGFNYLDGVIQLSTKPSLLQAQAMSYNDIVPGEQYHGIVIATLPMKETGKKAKAGVDDAKQAQKAIKNGVILQISPNVTAFVPLSQLTNQGAVSNTSLISTKFALGTKHVIRVLVSIPTQKKLIATAKPALLEAYGKHEVLADYTHAKKVFDLYRKDAKPFLMGGYVDKCTDKYIVVRFFNNIAGVITKNMLVEQGIITPTQTPEFKIGEYILTRVLQVYNDKLSLSLAISVSQNDQQSITKLTTIYDNNKKSKSAIFSPYIGSIIKDIRITGSQITPFLGLNVKFDIADKEYTGVIPQNQLSDQTTAQAALLKLLGTAKSGSGNYHSLSAAIVMGSIKNNDSSDVVYELSIKFSTFIMNSTHPMSTFTTILTPKRGQTGVNVLNDTLTALVDKCATIKKTDSQTPSTFPILPYLTLPSSSSASTTPYIGTVTQIEQDSIKVMVTRGFYAWVHRSKLIDSLAKEDFSNVDLATVYTLGQSFIFKALPSRLDENSATQYQGRIGSMIHKDAKNIEFVLKFEELLQKLFIFDAAVYSVPNTIIASTPQFPPGFSLGQVLSNAKITSFGEGSIAFSTPEVTKLKLKIVCLNTAYHAADVAESSAVGSTMDVTVIGYNDEERALIVTTLTTFKPKSKTASKHNVIQFTPEQIGVLTQANILYTNTAKNGNITVAIPSMDNGLFVLNSAVLPNSYSYEPFFTKFSTLPLQVNILPVSTSTAIYTGLAADKDVKKDAKVEEQPIPQGTFYDASIQSSADIQQDNTIMVKIVGLYKSVKGGSGDDVKVGVDEFDKIVDFRSYYLKTELGPVPTTPSPISRFRANISISSLYDPEVNISSNKGKKQQQQQQQQQQQLTNNLRTNICSELKNMLTNLKKDGLVKAKITSVSHSPQKVVIHLSIRPSDLESSDYQARYKVENHAVGSVQNAVIVKMNPVVGILAQITPFLQAQIDPTAAHVVIKRNEKKGTQKLKAGDFGAVEKAYKVGDVITLKHLTTVDNSTSLASCSLIDPEFNPNGSACIVVKKTKDQEKAEHFAKLQNLSPEVSTKRQLANTAAPALYSPLRQFERSIREYMSGVDQKYVQNAAYLTQTAKKITTPSIGQIVNDVTVVGYSEKGSFYHVILPGFGPGFIPLSEFFDYQDLLEHLNGEELSTFDPSAVYKIGSTISQVVVLAGMPIQGMETKFFLVSARQSRSSLLSSSTTLSTAVQAQSQQRSLKLGLLTTKKSTAPIVPVSTPGEVTTGVLTRDSFVQGQYVVAYVQAVQDAGVFVTLSPFVHGLIPFSDLTDYFTPANAIMESSLYTIGQPILCLVGDGAKNNMLKSMPQLVPLIAKPSMVNLNDAKLRSTLQPGTVLSAIVSTVNQFGVWVKIKDSVALRGFVHKSNCVDDRNVDFKNHYKPDDKVKVVVLGVNNDDGKITLGLKASLFTKLDKIKKAAGVVDVSEQFTTYLDSIKAVDSDDDDDDEDDNAMGDKPMTKLQEKQHKALEQTASHEQNVLSTLFSPLDTTTTKPVEKSTKKSTKKSAQMDNDDDDEEELIDFDINDDVMATRLNSTIGIKNANNKDSAERKIELLEHALVGLGDQSIMSSISTDQVYTVDQYEIQCAAQPNNAAVWISYMAFQLENNEIQKARDVCKKALKIITVTSLEQRWLIYSSLISIEILYGTVTSLEQSINLAVKEFEKIKVYAEIGRIAISSHKLPLSIEYYQKALRSSGLAQDAASNQTKPRTVLIQVQEIYISLISLLFAQQKRAEAQALLKQSMSQLPTQYTGLIVIKTILLEFQSDHGSVDTGRVMFQMFLKDNSKRVDVWTTWIQQEIKICKQLQQDINKNSTTAVSQAKKNQFKQQKTRIRELFDIFTTKSTNIYNITWKSLKPTQMKLIYSLAIDFENSPMCMGDSRSDVIKNRAQIYVEEVSA